MLKLKTSQQTKNQAPKPENTKIVKKDDPKTSIDHDDEQDETNLVEIVKKSEKKQPTLQQPTNDTWQKQDDPKDLPTNGIGKKPTASFKKQDEPAIELHKEEFPEIASVEDMSKPSKKQKKMNIQPKQDQPIQPAINSAGLFTNSSSKPQTQTQTTTNVQTKNTQSNSNSGSLTFTNTKKQEHTAYFQQQQQEQIKKIQQEPLPQAQQQIQETQKTIPPQRQANLSRNTNTVSQQAVTEQQKQVKVEESIPTFINSKAKGNPPIVSQQPQQQEPLQQQQQQQQEQQQQINEDEDSDGWETVEKKRKSKGTFQRNEKKT